MKSTRLMTVLLLPPTVALLQYQRLTIHNKAGVRTSPNSNKKRANQALLQMRLNPSVFPNTDYTITEFPRPALRRVPNAPITVFDDQFVSKTKEMMGVMYGSKGVGLAAPQIGLNENLFVYNPTGDVDSVNMERVVCNPTITKYSEEVQIEEEGCLSLRSDQCAGRVARSVWIETKYQDESGYNVRRRLKGFEARVFQHEYDHLKGILCYDRYAPKDREKVQAGIDNLLGLYTEEDAMLEPDPEMAKAMQPNPLSSRQMPPLSLQTEQNTAVEDDGRKKTKPKKSGFGAAGFGGGGTKTGASKKGKKKNRNKVRNGSFSSNPTFK